jgi:hypothetical protein
MVEAMIDVQRLRVFRAVVASGSVQAAADHLGYTPSAVSQQISALQRETGLVLFEKAGRGIAPTATAKARAKGRPDGGLHFSGSVETCHPHRKPRSCVLVGRAVLDAAGPKSPKVVPTRFSTSA